MRRDETAPRVAPGQVWNDDSVRRAGGPVLVISVDSGYAYCRDGRDGDGSPRRIALACSTSAAVEG